MVASSTTFTKIHEISSFYSGGSVVYTPDYLITADGEDVHLTPTRVTDKIGLKAKTLEGDSDIVTALAVQRNILVVASRSLQISIYDLDTFELVHRFRSYHQAPILSMDLHSSTHLLATGSADSMVRVFDLRTKNCTHVFRTSSLVSALKFYDNAGNWAAVAGCEDGRLYVWDMMDKSVKISTPAHTSVVRAISFSGWDMLTAGRDSVVCFWDMRTIFNPEASQKLEPLITAPVFEPVEYAGFIEPLVFNREQKDTIFYTAGEKGRLKFWNKDTLLSFASYPPTSDTRVLHPLIHALYDRKSDAFLLVDSHQHMSTVSVPSMSLVDMRIGTFDEITDLKFIGPNGRWLLVGSTSENVTIVDLGLAYQKDQTALPTGNVTMLPGHKGAIIAVDGDCGPKNLDADSVYIFASGSKDNSVKLWALTIKLDDSVSIRHIANFTGHVDEITSLCLSRKNQTTPTTVKSALASRFLVTCSSDRTMKSWDLSDINPDSDEIQHGTSLWTIKTHDKDVNSVHISHDNKLIATSSQDRTAKIWNIKGEPLGTLKGHKRGVWCVRFSPGDKYIATTSGDKTIKLWNPSDYSCVRTFESHTNSVLRVDFLGSTFSENAGKNQMMVSTGSDGLTKLWCISSTDCVLTLDNHEDKVWALAIRDGTEEPDSGDCMDCSSDEQPELNVAEIMNKCLIATGAGDSKIVVSLDITKEAIKKLQAEEEEKIVQDQELSNMVVRKDYCGAIRTALRLKRSVKIAEILKSAQMDFEQPKSQCSVFADSVDQMLSELNQEDLKQLLGYVKTWNTQAKWTQVSQGCLNVILKSHKPKELVAMPGIKETCDALIPYTEKHFARVDDLQTSCHLLDFVLNEMKVFSATSMGEDGPVGK